MVLLRHIIGETLRNRRQKQHRTLRDVSASANVSLGYLSEIERGHKEASSELLASICGALDVRMSEVLGEVTTEVAREEGVVTAMRGGSGARPGPVVSLPETNRAAGGDRKPDRKAERKTVPAPRILHRNPSRVEVEPAAAGDRAPESVLAPPISLDAVRARRAARSSSSERSEPRASVAV